MSTSDSTSDAHVPEWRDVFAELEHCTEYRRLRSLCRRAARIEKARGLPEGAVPLRVALLGGAMLDLIAEPLRLALIGRGFAPDLFVGGYGQFISEMLEADGLLDAFAPQVTIVVNTPFNVGRWPAAAATREEADELAVAACEELLVPCRHLNERTRSEIVVNSLHPHPMRGYGNVGARLPGDALNFVRRFNLQLGDRIPPYVHVNDVAAMAAQLGSERWLDLRYWYQAKQPLAFEAVPLYVRNTAAVVGAILGRRRKVAVLDLDNTLWGGVIGDDGLAGIQLGEGSASGEAFKAFQAYLRSLKDIGVLLAVCSKNEESIAEEAFAKHPEMVLRRDDFVSFKANWNPKSDNLRAIARELDLGLDSFVLIDDNPAEREQVRQELPEVAVPEIGEEPAAFARIVASHRYFETTAVTEEDRLRTAQYRARQSAAASLETATDLSSYLRSLEMQAVIRPFEAVSMERITQLTNKTNQFNLTTRRVTRPEMEAYAEDPAYVTLTLRLRDKFGDHGLVSVLWARTEGTCLSVQNWLMSCRVLKRGAENALLNALLHAARDRGLDTIRGEYLPTDRNAIVEPLYEQLGFVRTGSVEGGGSCWSLDVATAAPLETFIEIAPQSTAE